MKQKITNWIIGISLISGLILFGLDWWYSEEDYTDDMISFPSYVKKWDCSDPNGIQLATLAYGQEVVISHVKMPLVKDNECSYAYPDNFKIRDVPHSSKVYGSKARYLSESQKEFMSDLPFPNYDPWSIILVSTLDLKNPLFKKIASVQFKKEGQIIGGMFKNDFSVRSPLYVVAMYNLPYSQFNKQVGYGGYTTTFKVEIE